MKGPRIERIYGPIYESIVEAFGGEFGKSQVFLKEHADGRLEVWTVAPSVTTAEKIKALQAHWSGLVAPFMIFPMDRKVTTPEIVRWIMAGRAVASHPNCMFMVMVEAEKEPYDA